VKKVSEMSANQINKALDALDEKDSIVNSQLIAAGRGSEKYQDVLKHSDPLSQEAANNFHRRMELFREIESRAGPGTRRLPSGRGFGPLKVNPVKKPALQYVLHVQKPGGPVMTWNGERFTNNEPFFLYSNAGNARVHGRKLLKEFAILKDYKIWAAPKFATTKKNPIAVRKFPSYMRGGSKAPKVNPTDQYIGWYQQGTKAFYVSNLRGHGGKDWGYTTKPSEAITMTERMAKIFVNEVPGRNIRKSNPSARTNAELDIAAKKLEDFTGRKVGNLESAYSRSSQSTGLVIGELDLIGYRANRDGKTERYGHHFKKASRPLLAVTSDGKQLHIVGGRYEFTEAGIEDR
jgi:hypothetical protein